VQNTKSFLDYFLYAAGVGLSLYLYFMVDAFWGIISIFSVTILLLIYLLFTTPGTLIRIKYPPLIKTLQKTNLITEQDLQTKINWPALKLHRALYEIAKTWNLCPLILLNKKQYFYISASIMEEIIPKVHEIFTVSSKASNIKIVRAQLVGQITKQYPFLTRQQVEIVVAHLQRQMEKFPKKWEQVCKNGSENNPKNKIKWINKLFS